MSIKLEFLKCKTRISDTDLIELDKAVKAEMERRSANQENNLKVVGE